jgi:hypothetical protein
MTGEATKLSLVTGGAAMLPLNGEDKKSRW